MSIYYANLSTILRQDDGIFKYKKFSKQDEIRGKKTGCKERYTCTVTQESGFLTKNLACFADFLL